MKDKTISLISDMPRIILCSLGGINDTVVMLEKITSKDEELIDDSGYYETELNGKKQTIYIDKIYMYGDINLKNKEDIDLIIKNNLHGDMLAGYPTMVHDNFNYEEGNFVAIDGIVKTIPVSDPLLIFKHRYCRIGKPKRIICYAISRNRIRYVNKR